MSEFDEIMYQIKVYDDEYNKDIPDEWRMSLDNGKHYGRATQVYDFTKHRYIVVYISDNYDIHTEIQTLLQENKQLKEELENIKDFNNKLQASKDRLDRDDYNLAHILTELEEWLEMMEEKETIGTYSMVQDKIQELKEKYNYK